MLDILNDCKHVPTKEVHRFEDAWLGSIKRGHYEDGYTYEPIECRFCRNRIKATKDLKGWTINAD